MSRFQRIARWSVDPLVALTLGALYVALLLATVDTLGYARDEGFYFRAAGEYRKWFDILLEDPARALERSTVDRYWKTNREHPAFIKSLFALSNKYLFQEWKLFSEAGTSYRFPGMVLAGAAVGTVYLWGRAAIGRAAGLVAALLLALMPRVFYHSHLDCFDVPVLAMWLITTFAYWKSIERGGLGWAIATGVLYGLLLNTKHNAWLLPPALIVHFLLTRGFGGLKRDVRIGHTRLPLALLCMAVIGPVVFYATWPWLWHETARRFGSYVAFHAGHDYYNMEFLGETYFEPPMPRLYAWVMTAATVPGITLVLFGLGLVRSARETIGPRLARSLAVIRAWRRRRDPSAKPPREASGAREASGTREAERRFYTHTLWLLCLLVSYAPWLSENTPIFGGTKHWITAYPFLCLFAGLGYHFTVRALSALLPSRARRMRLAELSVGSAVVAAPLVMTLHSHPWGLTAYTPLVGGAPGAASLGLNRSFWGYTTGAVQDFINEAANRGARVYIHDTAMDSWRLLRKDGRVRPDLRPTLSLSSSEIALYHHEQHMARVEYQLWVDYGTVSPAHIGAYDGVPVVWVYERPRARPK